MVLALEASVENHGSKSIYRQINIKMNRNTVCVYINIFPSFDISEAISTFNAQIFFFFFFFG